MTLPRSRLSNTAVRCALLLASWSFGAQAEAPVESLAEYSLEQLSQLEVTSVSKTTEPLRAAPASIYVITQEEIVRSGATSIVEALRLAPNLLVSQYNGTYYVAGARGLGGAQEAQNFSNKLLILIDGRSVYSPLYSGVYLDVQDVLIDDIDRIEVISGPGATLWGANAMHGVINIITRPAYLTDAPVVSVGYGNLESVASARLGARASESLAYRVYAKAFEHDPTELADGSSAHDDWHKAQAGFRVDGTFDDDTITVQGDLYRGDQNLELPGGNTRVEGANVLGRWNRHGSDTDWQVQAYYDFTSREAPGAGLAFNLHTFDVELQNWRRFDSHRLIWGAGLRLHDYRISNSVPLAFEPPQRSLMLGNVFVQDTLSLTETLDLSIGLKGERDDFSGWNLLPEVRLAWRPSERTMVWGAASRGIRSPTPFDRDVVERFGDIVYLTGFRDFEPEQVDTFELGVRGQPGSRFSYSAAVFYNLYDDLRTIEPASAAAPLPFHWDNRMEGDSYGFEAWAKWQVTDWWRLAPGLRLLEKNLEFSRGASELLGLWQSGNDPSSQALLTSSMNLGPAVTLDATLRHVGALPEPELDSYQELNVTIGWRALPDLDLSLSGFNLLES
ncbi:MAG TPA: TonB-dependent receptor, partial [Steroidobacteraceae bacterium]|nr:TonB-dependent receptor [Steroidobacteraceae bacterium]